MNKELEFALKILRNGLILAVLYFASIWATSYEINFQICKPAILFLIFYVCTELAKHYGIDKEIKIRGKNATLIF